MVATILREIATEMEFIEAQAMADGFLATSPGFQQICGFHLERVGSAFVMMVKKIDAILFNRVIGLGLMEPATEEMLDTIVAYYTQKGVCHFAVQVSPLAQPAELPVWLAARGFQKTDNWAKCYRGNEMPPIIATDLRIVRIGPEHGDSFARIASVVFHMPGATSSSVTSTIGRSGWYHYLAFADERPVATAVLFVQGYLGYLCIGATLPAYRGRGAQGALIVQRIRDALALGCRWLTTETGEDVPELPNPSYHNMLRTGFQLTYLRPNYIYNF